MKENANRNPIVLSGRTYVTGALADLFPSRETSSQVRSGDLKLWCHMFKSSAGAMSGQSSRVASGQFRAAVYDGKDWRTFRLNFVADSDAYYNGFDDRTTKAKRCFAALATLKGQNAYWRKGSFGIVSTMRSPAAGDTVSGASVPSLKTAAPTTAGQSSGGSAARRTQPAALEAARSTGAEPGLSSGPRQTETGSKDAKAGGRRRRKRGVENPDQLKLF